MKYVLLIVFLNAWMPAPVSMDFEDRQACLEVLASIVSAAKAADLKIAMGACFAKGTAKPQ